MPLGLLTATGLDVPIPTFPLPCCTTNCEPPTVNPCPAAIVVVPEVPVNAPLAKTPTPVEVKLPTTVEEAWDTNPLANVARPLAESVELKVPAPATERAAPRATEAERQLAARLKSAITIACARSEAAKDDARQTNSRSLPMAMGFVRLMVKTRWCYARNWVQHPLHLCCT
jgi:hypothetical protein